MKTSHKRISPLFFFIIVSLFFSHAIPQTPSPDSCNSPLTLQNTLPFDTNSLHCVSVWSSQNFILRYAQAGPGLWNFLLSAPNSNAYVGIGFSTNGNMVGSTAIVGWVVADGTSNIRKYFLGGQSPNLVTLQSTDQGLQIGNTSMASQSNRIYMAFQFSGSQPSTRLLYSVGPTGRLPAGPNFQLSEHQDRISTVLNYATGRNVDHYSIRSHEGQFQSHSNPESGLRTAHGLLNMVGWAILLTIGAIVSRYMRHWDPLWFYAHVSIQLVGFLLGFIGIICGFVLENRLKVSVDRHKGIGIFILAMGCLQVVALLLRPKLTSKVRKYWNWYHFGVGRLLILFAAINVFYGIHLGNAGNGWNVGFAIVLVVLFILSVVLEIKLWV